MPKISEICFPASLNWSQDDFDLSYGYQEEADEEEEGFSWIYIFVILPNLFSKTYACVSYYQG